mmetsp:Transcript_7854/g.7016  ORF Transcript_7854/g.7016 Transcript_7854/m.7016 type:complete len:180 (-) Transcript_7854:63-602(-)
MGCCISKQNKQKEQVAKQLDGAFTSNESPMFGRKKDPNEIDSRLTNESTDKENINEIELRETETKEDYRPSIPNIPPPAKPIDSQLDDFTMRPSIPSTTPPAIPADANMRPSVPSELPPPPPIDTTDISDDLTMRPSIPNVLPPPPPVDRFKDSSNEAISSPSSEEYYIVTNVDHTADS